MILSDALNHASIVDAIRLSRGRPARSSIRTPTWTRCGRGSSPAPRDARKLVITDGVFSMEGDVAPLPAIVELARAHDAIVVVDDSHAVGVLGATGRGTAEHLGLLGEVDVVTGTLGKALGGAAGGYVAASREVCDLLAQRSRPQLFSNALPPTVACSARRRSSCCAATRPLLGTPADERRSLPSRGCWPTAGRRSRGDAAIVPIIVGETAEAIRLSERLLDEGVFVTGFGYPVVPEGTARVRVQISAAHQPEHLDRALAAFGRVRER